MSTAIKKQGRVANRAKYAAPSAAGQCQVAGTVPACQAWNTLTETVCRVAGPERFAPLARAPGAAAGRHRGGRSGAALDRRRRIRPGPGRGHRAGGVVLIGGDPGIGKSTLLLQSLGEIADERRRSISAAKNRTRRWRCARNGSGWIRPKARSRMQAEIGLEKIQATIKAKRPDVAVIDSIQTVYSEALKSAPGSVAQVRECAAQLTRIAKQSGTAIIMVGHVTKEGNLAGPRVLEHIVDTVLYFEGDTHSSFRLVRAFKNRFGAVNEIGVFAMTERGLRGVANPRRCSFRSTSRSCRARACWSRRKARGRCSSKCRRWWTRPIAESTPPRGGDGAEPAGDAAGGAASARRDCLLRSGRLSQRRGRRPGLRAGGGSGGAGRDCFVVA